MIATIYRFAASLTVLSVAFTLYRTMLVPQIEPPIARREVDLERVEFKSVAAPELNYLFQENSWQRNKPKRLETPQGIVLFRDYQQTSQGRMEIKPCSIVFFTKKRNMDGEFQGRPIVLDAPQGAVLKTDKAIGLTRTDMGRVAGAQLIGPVHIWSLESAKGKGDALSIRANNLQIDENRVWTPNEVEFAFGKHKGRGKDLSLFIAQSSDRRKRELKRLELVHLEFLELEIKDPVKKSAVKPSTARRRRTTNPAEKRKALIRADGPFQFDFNSKVAWFERNVDVAVPDENGTFDRLQCPDRLSVFFRTRAEEADNGKSSSETPQPQTSTDAFSSLEPSSIVAEGRGTRLIAPSHKVNVTAQTITYHLVNNWVRLEDPDMVRLAQEEQLVEAPWIEYRLNESKNRLGRMSAKGPGRIETVRVEKNKKQTLVATWNKELQVDRQNGVPVLSLLGGANVDVPSVAKCAADEIHVWLEEKPHPNRKDAVEIKPAKMAALGNVSFDSTQATGNCNQIEVWIQYAQTVVEPVQPVEEIGGNRSREVGPQKTNPAVANNANNGQFRFSGIDEKKGRKYKLIGDKVQIQLLQTGKEIQVHNATVQGNVHVEELLDSPRKNEPMSVRGEIMQMNRTPLGFMAISVRGEGPQTAKVTVRGANVESQNIQLNQDANQLWINGAGSMTLQPKSPHAGQPTVVRWGKGMTFDGKRARLEGGVDATGQRSNKKAELTRFRVTARTLDLTFAKRIDFKAKHNVDSMKKDEQIEFLVFQGNVVSNTTTFDAAGQQIGVDRLAVPSLTVNQLQQSFRADGPGWGSTIRFAKKQQLNAVPGSGVATTNKQERQRVFVRASFQRMIDGNYGQGQVQCQGKVDLVYLPVNTWDDRIVINHPAELGKEGVAIRCDRLLGHQHEYQKNKWMELVCSGNAHIENAQFTAEAERLTYTQLKDIVELDGGTGQARLWLNANNSTDPDAIARKLTYHRKTNGLRGEGVTQIKGSQFGGF